MCPRSGTVSGGCQGWPGLCHRPPEDHSDAAADVAGAGLRTDQRGMSSMRAMMFFWICADPPYTLTGRDVK